MAADKTLVDGAYAASRYYGERTDAAKARFDKVIADNIKKVTAKKQEAEDEAIAKQQAMNAPARTKQEAEDKAIAANEAAREEEWKKATPEDANAILAGDGSMSSDDFAIAQEVVGGQYGKGAFLSGDKLKEAEAQRNLGEWTQQLGDIKDYRTQNAELLLNANTGEGGFNEDGYSLALQSAAARGDLEILSSHTNKQSLYVNSNMDEEGNEKGVSFQLKGAVDEEGNPTGMSGLEARALSDKYSVDVASKGGLYELKNTWSTLAEEGDVNDVAPYDKVKSQVDALLKEGKELSLWYDPLVRDGVSLKDDLYESDMLKEVTYKSLGLDEEQIAALDKDGDGLINANDGLSPEDQESVIEMLSSSQDPAIKDIRKNLTSQYYTNFVMQGWNEKHNLLIQDNTSGGKEVNVG